MLYSWEKTGWRPIFRGRLGEFMYEITRIRRYILRRTHISPLYSMNPFEYWYMHNEHLSNHFNKVFKDDISLIKNDELKDDASWLYSEGNIMEKC